MATPAEYSLEDFLAAFPEFSEVDEAFLELKLQEAAREIDVSVWLERSADGVHYLAAHLLASTPWGNTAKLSTDNGSTTYEARYNRLRRSVAAGLRCT